MPKPTLKLTTRTSAQQDLAQGSTALPALVGEPTLPPQPGVSDYASVIAKLWMTSQRTFLQIGRYLDEAERSLSEQAYEQLVAELPFGRTVRIQLMTAYREISKQHLPAGVEQAGYSVIYQVAKLSDEERQEAIKEGVISPTMRRQDIVKFRKRKSQAVDRSTQLLAERERLAKRMAEIDAELAELKK